MGSTWPFTARSSTRRKCLRPLGSAPRSRILIFELRLARLASRGARAMLRAIIMETESDNRFGGYTVSYDREEIQFPVYVSLILGAALLFAAVAKESFVLLLLSLVVVGFVFHNYPLLETGKIRLAANQDGLFIDGLGLLAWKAIDDIDIVDVVVRANAYKELEISLSRPLALSLLEDGRNAPLLRRLMRKPYYLRRRNVRVPLEVFDQPAEEIFGSLKRKWNYNRGRI